MFHPTAKLAPKCHGPFPIIRVLSPITYELQLPAQWKLHPVFHVDLLTPYRETEFHGANYDKPPPDLIDGEEEYEVERIVASRHFGRGHKLQYLVKWKGYPDAENQWVAKEDVFAEDAIREFQNLNSNPGVHIRRAQTDPDSHSPFSECPLPGLNLAPSLRTCSTSTLANLNVTSNSEYSATSRTSTEGSTPVSVGSRVASTITTTKPMIIPEAPYAPPEPPFRRYADTHDSIGCAELTTPEEEACSRNALTELWEPPLLRPTTTSEPGTRSSPLPPTELPSPETSSMPLCSASPLRLREPSDRQSLRPLTTTSSTKPQGKSATTSPSHRPRLIAFVTLSQSVRPVPHLDLS
jgi:hypothetical protein